MAQSQENLRGDWNGLSIKEVAQMYRKKQDEFGIQGYELPKQAEKQMFQMKNVLKFIKEDPKKTKTYLN